MKVKWHTDRTLSIAAVFISVLSLVFFIYETNMTRKHNRLSVLPRLVFNSNLAVGDSTAIYQLEIENKGLGPAFIDSIRIVDEKENYPMDFASYIEKFYPKLNHLSLQTAALNKGSIVSEKSSTSLIRLEVGKSSYELALQIYESIEEEDRIFVVVYYNSIYEEGWRISSKKTDQVPIKIR